MQLSCRNFCHLIAGCGFGPSRRKPLEYRAREKAETADQSAAPVPGKYHFQCRLTLNARTVQRDRNATEAAMQHDPETSLTAKESQTLRRLAAIMVPQDGDFGVPGADDPVIFADIEKSLGRDCLHVKAALDDLAALSDAPFSSLDDRTAEILAYALLGRGGPAMAALGRVILQCYYRDDRVVRSLGLDPRSPFPKGHTLEQGDWSLLDPVRARPKMWRDVP
jgi:hypothetical protein